MNVFCDLHHGGLFESLRLLFEKRLGWNLYRPIGMDWYTSGYWKIADPYGGAIDTAKQYLDLEGKVWNPYTCLNADYTLSDGIYHVYDPVHEVHQQAITLSQFKEMPIDIVISSIPAHDESFAELIKQFKPKAKHIAQIGNIYQDTNVQNVMCSTMWDNKANDKHIVFYHQEFDLNVFFYQKPKPSKEIKSFINCLPEKDTFELLKVYLREFNFKAYGASCPDGTITGIKNIAKEMQSALFGYHVKPGGDGFGHIIHNWFACGRPVIVRGNYYCDKLAGRLLLDARTCIDLDKSDFNGNLNKIRYWSLPENHEEMCQEAYRQFKNVVDFDSEFDEIKRFLETII